MSFPLTIPVSVPHRYVNHFYVQGGNCSTALTTLTSTTPIAVYNKMGHLQSTSAGAAAPVILMPPTSTPINQGPSAHQLSTAQFNLAFALNASKMEPSNDAHFPHRQPPPPPQVFAVPSTPAQRFPMRKQSVFVAPSNLSSIHVQPPMSSAHLNFSTSQPGHRSHSHTSSSPLDLSDNPSPPSRSSVIQTQSSSRSKSQPSPPQPRLSKEHLSQHISKLILENEAIVDSCDPIFTNSQSRQQPACNVPSEALSKRSVSIPQMQASPGSLVGPSSVGSDYSIPILPYQQQASLQLEPNRRYSSDVPHLNSYSKLQSALLGEVKQTSGSIEMLPSASKANISRKYSENLSHHRSSPSHGLGDHMQHSSLFHPYYSASNYLIKNNPSVIINAKHLGNSGQNMMFPLDTKEHLLSPEIMLNTEGSRSSSEPSLVRNLLQCKTSPLAHMNSSSISDSSLNQVNPDGSIIKDLLLKPRSSVTDSPLVIQSVPSATSSRRKFRSSHSESHSSVMYQSGNAPSGQSVFACTLCYVAFRNKQNLEVHQKHYCKGNDSDNKHHSGQMQKRSLDESNSSGSVDSRKSLQEQRPSIIVPHHSVVNQTDQSLQLSSKKQSSSSTGSTEKTESNVPSQGNICSMNCQKNIDQ